MTWAAPCSSDAGGGPSSAGGAAPSEVPEVPMQVWIWSSAVLTSYMTTWRSLTVTASASAT